MVSIGDVHGTSCEWAKTNGRGGEGGGDLGWISVEGRGGGKGKGRGGKRGKKREEEEGKRREDGRPRVGKNRGKSRVVLLTVPQVPSAHVPSAQVQSAQVPPVSSSSHLLPGTRRRQEFRVPI
jgi:hypothetical protein